jgi:hypothetical protein
MKTSSLHAVRLKTKRFCTVRAREMKIILKCEIFLRSSGDYEAKHLLTVQVGPFENQQPETDVIFWKGNVHYSDHKRTEKDHRRSYLDQLII